MEVTIEKTAPLAKVTFWHPSRMHDLLNMAFRRSFAPFSPRTTTGYRLQPSRLSTGLRYAAILQNDPEFALMFALAYRHRASLTLVKALDTWFA